MGFELWADNILLLLIIEQNKKGCAAQADLSVIPCRRSIIVSHLASIVLPESKSSSSLKFGGENCRKMCPNIIRPVQPRYESFNNLQLSSGPWKISSFSTICRETRVIIC